MGARPAALGDRVSAIHQLVPTLAPDDATGNAAFAMQAVLRSWGYESEIFARNVDPAIADRARSADALPKHDRADAALILHYGLYARDVPRFLAARGPKVLHYHNVTPAHFFRAWDLRPWLESTLGRGQLPWILRGTDLVLADSPYNGAELEALGARHVRPQPLLLDLDGLAATMPSSRVLDRWGDGFVNVLFVGRLAPNKRQDDLIRAFARYRAAWNPFARLLLVGGESVPAWGAALRRLARELDLASHVVFVGPATAAELAAYYRVAHVFVSLSDHEGFGIPLVEAMRFDVPVLARAAGAVPDTLAGAGILLAAADGPEVVAAAVARVVGDEALRAAIVAAQRRRLADLSWRKAVTMLAWNLGEVLG